MEVTAALEAVRALPGALVVVSDSQYVVKCHTDRWYEKWEKSGWNNSNRKPVANADLWKPLVALFHARGDELKFQWVRGHSEDPMNDLVDRLAVEAARTQTARCGSDPPTVLGPPDETVADRRAPRSSSSLVVPDGHAVVVFGHRPPELGGYGDNPIAAGVRRKLTEILTGLRAVHPDLVVLTGLSLGAEQLGAEAAAAANVPYVAVLPFPEADAVWPAASRAAFQRLVAGAVSTLVMSNAKPTSKQAAGMALGRRDDWLRTHANGALAVWDGRDRTIGSTVKALERRIPDDVWIVPPVP
jgi:ribonuclease HI